MSTPGPGRGRGRGTGPRPVIAPRGRGRRTQAERDKHAEEERARNRDRDEEYQKVQKAQEAAIKREENIKRRALQNKRGGRGGFMGEATQLRGGVFAQGSAPNPNRFGSYSRSGATSNRGRTGDAKNFDSIKREGEEGFSYSRTTKPGRLEEQANIISSDDEEGGERVDIDVIDLTIDEDGVATRISGSLFPVTIAREEHPEREHQLKSEISVDKIKKLEDDDIDMHSIPITSNKKGKQRAKDVEITRSQRVWQGVYGANADSDSITIKEEDDTETVPILEALDLQPDTPTTVEEKTPKPRARRRHTNEPSGFQTTEDIKEWGRHLDDLDAIVHELSINKDKPATTSDDPIDADANNAQADVKEDRVYLFQFPPVVPNLFPFGSAVKEEPKAAGTGRQAPATSSKATPAKPAPATGSKSTPQAAQPTNSSAPTGAGTSTEEAIPVKDDPKAPKPLFPERPSHLPHLTPGNVGKLRVYKSGKAALDWGGTSLQLNMGVMPFFLQDSVMVKLKPQDSGVRAKEPPSGEAMSFGQVRGKFVVTPDWDEVLGKF
ncbi:hypothetical protein BT63DRAFT_316004 [Microthyrium microscopicum]|uniref:DNA-directed RNA polymerase III RPC4 n=1 Tax=Microthyrium microscopicum TaxID=703497 RepID=A0A6A6U333_9PEZI|nr:hypothetical protein BT63DRAFT_316004 [Microthyrium microscopicum]